MKRYTSDSGMSKRRGSRASGGKSVRRHPQVSALESRLLLTVDLSSTILSASAPMIASGQALTLTAAVEDVSNPGAIPNGGTVTFQDGTTTLGTATVSNGTATFSPTSLAVGRHQFTAAYGGTVVMGASTAGIGASSRIEAAAGTGTAGYGGDGGPATASAINYPYAIAFDAQGNLFIADAYNNVVREVTTDGIIHTVAGNGNAGYTGDGGPATQAELNTPEGLAFNSAGDLFISDAGNNVIREVTTDGNIHTFAGNGTQGSTGDGGPATQAELNTPEGLAVDAAGDLFVASNGSKNVREVTTDGNIHTFAGTGIGGYSGDGGPATAAEVQPTNVAMDSHGDVFIADLANNVVREVTTDGIIHTVAGTGTGGYSGDGGPATSAELQGPEGLAFDAAGDLFISDSLNNVVREVTTDGIIHTVAGTGAASSRGDGGQAGSATLNFPYGLAFDASGDLLIGEYGDSVIRKVVPGASVVVTADGTTTTLAASAASAAVGSPVTLTATVANLDAGSVPTGSVTFKDGATTLGTATLTDGVATFTTTSLAVGQHALVATYGGATDLAASTSGLATNNTIRTVAGNGTAGNSGIGGPATSAEFNPDHTAVDAQGDVYIADQINNRVYKVTPDGVIHVFAGDGTGGYSGDGGAATSAQVGRPVGLAIDAQGDVFIDEYVGQAVREVTTDGIIHTVAGNGSGGYSGDGGPATSAQLGNPSAVAVDAAGDLFIADSTNQVVREVTTDGIIHTVAGNGVHGYGGDGGPATSAELGYPTDIAVDAAGDLFIADNNNNAIREVTTDGIIHTVAGNGNAGYTGDGGSAIAAELSGPNNITLDPLGDLFIADTTNNVVREVTTDGTIHSLAGTGAAGYTGDGGAAGASELNAPVGLALDAAGDLFITDSGNNVVRKVQAGLALTVTPPTATHFSVTVSSPDPVAGTVETVTITAVDSNGNVAPNFTGTVHLTSGDGRAILPVDVTLTDGVATALVTLETAGLQSITATDVEDSGIGGTASAIDVLPASATRFLVNPANGTPNAFTIAALDAFGNVAKGYSGTVHLTSDDPLAVLPADTTLGQGLGTVRVILETPGAHAITATDAEAPSIRGTLGNVQPVTVSGTVYLDLNAGDADKPGMPGLAGRVVFLDLNGDGTLDPGDPTATTDAQGRFTLVGGLAGEFPVLEAIGQDGTSRHVVDQTSIGGDAENIGVVPISPVAPVAVVPGPFSTTRSGDPNAAFVQSLYRAVLGRDGNDWEVGTWLGQMANGMDRRGVASGFINSTEHRQDEVNAYYEEFLKRPADPSSVVWVDDLLAGASEESVVEAILGLPEYRSAHPDNASFVDSLYLDVLGRRGDAGGATAWESALSSGMTRDAVIADFVNSREAIDQLVTSDYTAFLHRQPELGTSGSWATSLESPRGSATDVAIGILASDEFAGDARTP